MFFKYFASKNQLPGSSVNVTLSENGLIENGEKRLVQDIKYM